MPPVSNLPVAGGGQALQFQRFSPDQLQDLQKVRSGGMQGLDALQGLSFDPIEERARTQFQQQTIPSIAERFTSLGGRGASAGGALSSPAFASQLGQAGSGLEEALAALRSQFGLQQQGNLLQQLQLGLQPTFENIYSPPGPGAASQFAGSFGQGAGQILPFLLLSALTGGGGAAAAGGAGLFGMLKNLLGGGL